MENYIIRPETEADFETIYQLVKIAFQTAKISDGDEQDYVLKLRASENYIPELALVAESAGELIGHIMLTRMEIENDRQKYATLLLAPLAVEFAYRSQGVGAALVQKAIKLAANLRYKSVFLVGYPDYYTRFGFRPSVDYGIRNTNGFPEENVLACELQPHSLDNVKGIIHFTE
jgi:putative acetyltransferase